MEHRKPSYLTALFAFNAAKSCTFTAKAWYRAAVFMCYSSDFQLVFGENVVLKYRNYNAVLAVWQHKNAILSYVSAKAWCDVAF